MTKLEAVKMLKAKLECMTRDVSGSDDDCNRKLCGECHLNYEKGNMREQKEYLQMAIEALEQEPCENAIRYFNIIQDLSQTCGLPYSFVDEKIKEIVKALKALSKEPCKKATIDKNYWKGFNNGIRTEKFRESKQQKPCADTISRQAALSTQYKIDDSATLSTRDVVNVDDIKDLPPVKPAEKVGHWINPTTMQCMKEQVFYYCSVCGNYADANKYCPYCGAKMQEVKDANSD